MEKLQAALEKARKNRGERPVKIPTRKQLDFSSGPRDGETWEALAPLELDEEKLIRHLVVTRQAGTKATPFDILRTKALLQMRQNGWKRLAITSPMPQVGKTTVACNLGLGLGRQRDLRSILFDFDLGTPSMHRFLEVEPPHDIGDVMTGKVSFADQALCYNGNVAFSLTNKLETDPTRLLLAEETAQMLDEIENAYQPDVMIFDLPSMLVKDDTRAFLKNVDCALIVARAENTRYSQFDTCEREIGEHTNVLGTVLNAVRLSD